MPASPIILNTLKKKIKIHPFKFIVIIKLALPSHHSETHFPLKKLIIAQVGATLSLMFIFCLIIFWDNGCQESF